MPRLQEATEAECLKALADIRRRRQQQRDEVANTEIFRPLPGRVLCHRKTGEEWVYLGINEDGWILASQTTPDSGRKFPPSDFGYWGWPYVDVDT